MKSHLAFCSACDKEVHIVVTDEPSQDGHANLHESEVVCLEIGHKCTGGMCPVGATSPAVMAARLVRNGLQTRLQPLVTLECPECEGPTSFVVVEPSQATCTVCGTRVKQPPAVATS